MGDYMNNYFVMGVVCLLMSNLAAGDGGHITSGQVLHGLEDTFSATDVRDEKVEIIDQFADFLIDFTRSIPVLVGDPRAVMWAPGGYKMKKATWHDELSFALVLANEFVEYIAIDTGPVNPEIFTKYCRVLEQVVCIATMDPELSVVLLSRCVRTCINGLLLRGWLTPERGVRLLAVIENGVQRACIDNRLHDAFFRECHADAEEVFIDTVVAIGLLAGADDSLRTGAFQLLERLANRLDGVNGAWRTDVRVVVALYALSTVGGS